MKTSPFEDGERRDFAFGKVGVENAKWQKTTFPQYWIPMEDSYSVRQEVLLKDFLLALLLDKKLKMKTDLKTVTKGLQDQEVDSESP